MRIDKSDKVNDIVQQLVDSGDSYLRHWKHADSTVLPKIKERLAGKYIEMDFSENIALNTKNKVQEVYFSGKQHVLHCTIVQPGEIKFVYCLIDDTTHHPSFVHQVLEDIFDSWEIMDETVVIKSDNAPFQYKNKWDLELYSALAKKCNVCIIRMYGATGHRKGLTDAISSFGVKSILKRDIVGLDVWFANSQEICQYLDLHKDPRMSYSLIDQAAFGKKRMQKIARKIDGCIVKHLLDYKLGPMFRMSYLPDDCYLYANDEEQVYSLICIDPLMGMMI